MQEPKHILELAQLQFVWAKGIVDRYEYEVVFGTLPEDDWNKLPQWEQDDYLILAERSFKHFTKISTKEVTEKYPSELSGTLVEYQTLQGTTSRYYKVVRPGAYYEQLVPEALYWESKIQEYIDDSWFRGKSTDIHIRVEDHIFNALDRKVLTLEGFKSNIVVHNIKDTYKDLDTIDKMITIYF